MFREGSAFDIHPAVRTIVSGADKKFNGIDVFKAYYKLQELSRACHAQWDANKLDVLITPTASCNYTVNKRIRFVWSSSLRLLNVIVKSQGVNIEISVF